MYAKLGDTVKLTVPLDGSIAADVETVKNLSPSRPVAPVIPVAP
jgi:hypothetical protein